MVSVKALCKKFKILSRMIASLFDSSNEYFTQIPKQAEELIVITEDMDAENLIEELISLSIIRRAKYETIKERKRQFTSYFEYHPKFYGETELKLLMEKKLRYQHFDNVKNDMESAIINDDVDEL